MGDFCQTPSLKPCPTLEGWFGKNQQGHHLSRRCIFMLSFISPTPECTDFFLFVLWKDLFTKPLCICTCEDTFLGINAHIILNVTAAFKKKKILSGALHKYLATLKEVILGQCVFLTQCSAVWNKAVWKAPSNSRGFVLIPIQNAFFSEGWFCKKGTSSYMWAYAVITDRGKEHTEAKYF